MKFVGSAQLDPIPCEVDIFDNLDIDGDGINNFGPDGIEGTSDDDPDIDGDGEFTPGPDGVLGTLDDICVSNCNGINVDIDGDGIDNFGADGIEGTSDDDPDIDGDGISNIDDPDVDGDGILNNYDNNAYGGNSANNDPLPYYGGATSAIAELEGLGAGVYSIIVSDGACQPLDVIGGIELIDPPNELSAQIMQNDSVSCPGLSDGTVVINFNGGVPNNWNWGLYDEEDNLVDVGVNLIEEGDIVISNLSAGSYLFTIYDINGFSVTDLSQAYLGLESDEVYHSFNQGCSYSMEVVVLQPESIEINSTQVEHPYLRL